MGTEETLTGGKNGQSMKMSTFLHMASPFENMCRFTGNMMLKHRNKLCQLISLAYMFCSLTYNLFDDAESNG
jgi:hypothetical protein